MEITRVIQVSDSHLSTRSPFADANWDVVVDYVNANRPELVVHTGDISLDGADHLDDLLYARAQLNRLRVPWLAIPGNHDLGDLGETTQPVTAARRERYAAVFGQGSWMLDLGGWRLVGVDVQTLASDLDAAPRLWHWLEATLAVDVPTALFLHRPLQPWRSGENDDPRRYLQEPARGRLVAGIAAGCVRLVASGHVHQWRRARAAPARVWAPATWASLSDSAQPVIGAKVVGFVEHQLDRDGTVRSKLLDPIEMSNVVIGVDFPSPYVH